MRKVLIIGYFAPYRGGSGRMLGLAKYLHEFGWEPIILTATLETRPEQKFRLIETPYPGDIFSFWRKIFARLGLEPKKSITEQIKTRSGIASQKSFVDWLRTKYQELFAYPDTEKRWRKPALRAATEFLKKGKVDAIISVWPVTSHLIAEKMKAEFGIPWIADFPDPWSENHDYPYGKIRKWFDRKLEIKTIKTADVLTAASPGYAEKEESVNRRKVEAIPLGFDPAAGYDKQFLLTKKFTVTYTGTIYTNKQDPTKLLKAVSELIKEGVMDEENLEIRFFGSPRSWLRKSILELGLQKVAFEYGPVSKTESIAKQRESQILLILGWEDEKETGIYTLKTFEYLAAKRPILFTGGRENEKIKNIIRETKAGVCALTVQEIKDQLRAFYGEFRKNGSVAYRGDSSQINKYSYRTMAEKFAKILDNITK